MSQGKANFIQSLGEAFLGKRIDIKMVFFTGWSFHGLRRKIDTDRCSIAVGDLLSEFSADISRKNDSQQAVLDAVRGKNITETRCNQAAESGIDQCIHGTFPRRTAAKVLVADDNRSVAVGFFVKGKLFPFCTGFVIPQVVKQELFIADRARVFKEPGRENLIGVHIDLINGNGAFTDFVYGVHDRPSSPSSRTSVRCPVIAAAAAIIGLTRWVRDPLP